MNKKFLVTAMSLVLAGGMGLANADVKVYGQLDLSLDSTDFDNGEDDINMGANRSGVGFKGKEDLGGGMKSFFKVEFQVDLDDSGTGAGTNEDDTAGSGGSEWKGRDMYIGLGFEGFGKLTFGTMSTAYKSPGSKIDPFYRTASQSRSIGLQSALHKGRGEEGQGRATNTIRYDSPSLSGFKATATYTFDNNKNGNAEDDDPYSLGVIYKAGNLFGFASYMTTQQGDDDSVFQFGGKYKFGDFSVRAIYEIDDGLISGGSAGNVVGGNGDKGADIFSLGGSFMLGNSEIAFDYGEGQESDDDLTPSYTVWRFGAKHNFSKRTMVYANFSQMDVDGPNGSSNDGEKDRLSLGIRHNF